MVPVQLGRYCCCKLWNKSSDEVLWEEIMTIVMERVLAWKILPRLMMIMMSLSAWRVVEWFMTLPEPTTQQSALVSVVTGAMTGAFAVWMGHEK